MVRTMSLVLLALCLTAGVGYSQSTYDHRIARLSYMDGHVSFQHAGDTDWSAASINLALQPSDRIYTGEDGRAEIQFDDGSILRLAEKADIEVLSLKEDLIQIKVLAGLTTLNVNSSIQFEVNTPAAAFNTLRKGVYRLDIHENGDTDVIVRKGLIDAANNTFSRRVEMGHLLHVTAGDRSTNDLSRYSERDAWDEWNDRRNADLVSYDSRRYLPDYVQVGVRDLDTHGRWVDVDGTGPGWVPSYVDAGWTPYSIGRWCYRPFWGWTWVSDEPWGWLPYHYGSWHHTAGFGWAWIPGVSFGFHFWSPGLVRFYTGPSWVSWCPLGPGDYYNVNSYSFGRGYHHYLNDLRLAQRRGPGDLSNRHVTGAFRTVTTSAFADGSLDRGRRTSPVENVDQPWAHGRVVTDRLDLAPSSRSYSAAPDRPAARPQASAETRRVFVRNEPSGASRSNLFSRVSGASANSSATSGDRGMPSRENAVQAPESEYRPSIWNRQAPAASEGRESPAGRVYQSRPNPDARDTRGNRRDVPAGGSSTITTPQRQDRVNPMPPRTPDRSAPNTKAPQTEKPREQDRPRPEARPRPPQESDTSQGNIGRSSISLGPQSRPERESTPSPFVRSGPSSGGGPSSRGAPSASPSRPDGPSIMRRNNN